MKSTLTLDAFSDLRGAEVRSADNKNVGTVHSVFCDEHTKVPEWMGLATGFLGLKEVIVPVEGATIEGDCIHIPYDKAIVNEEPGFDEEDGALAPESDHRLSVYVSLTGHRPEPQKLTRYAFMRSNL